LPDAARAERHGLAVLRFDLPSEGNARPQGVRAVTDEGFGAKVRALMRSNDRIALATAAAHEAGRPHVSLAIVACATDASPILLLSALAEHTRNIARDARVALLYDGTRGQDDPLSGMRVTVVGRALPSTRTEDRSRFLARHPSARGYADFTDFSVFRIAVDRAHLVAGFGQVCWLDAGEVLFQGGASALMTREAEIVDHMNKDHADAVRRYATSLLGCEAGDWLMTGIDPEGCDLRRGGATARLTFPHPIASPDEARAMLVQLAREARQ
jgi:hypothetical protein